MKVKEIAKLIDGSILSEGENQEILALSLDSRSAKGLANELFIAISGANHDGHEFIPELAAKGIQNFIVERNTLPIPDCNIIKVNSSVSALQKISSAKRTLFHKEVVGITGSNGKTIVKEWLATILSTGYNVIKSPKSYNSQIGVPLSVWPLDPKYDIAVFEAGISRPGEMQNLEKVISPTLGIFTNIGTAHDESFDSHRQKTLEKLKLFTGSETLIFRADQTEVALIINESFQGKKISWSANSQIESSFNVDIKHPGQILIEHNGKLFSLKTNFTDKGSLENLIHAVICAITLGLTEAQIQRGISMISPVKMRLELKKGINNTYLIDDTYNNDFAGLAKALDFMDQEKQMTKRTVILSDFIQGKNSSQFYLELNELLIQKGIDKLITIGPQLSENQKLFSLSVEVFNDTEAFLASRTFRQFKDELLLIKGARQFRLERVSKALAEKAHKTVLEINLDAIVHNLNYYKSLLKPETRIMAVVKALAYGAGSAEVSKLLEYHKVDYLAVAYADEGVLLRQNGLKSPIMVMNASQDDSLNLIEYDLEPEIYSLEQLEGFLSAYQLANKVMPAHLILNTGMNRLGFNESDLDSLIQTISDNPEIRVKSIFTHLAASEDPLQEDFTKEQVALYKNAAKKIETALSYKPLRHVLNSGGIVRHNEFQEDMVRLGIGLHGIEVSALNPDKLQNPATLRTVVSQLRTVKAGETIGYGRKGKVESETTIATIAIGYADGYLRHFSNGNAHVRINGQKAKTIGNICMDMTMIDVTGLEVEEGDEVIIFGNNPTVSELAEWANTIPYEILTNVSNRVKRVFYSK